MDLPCFWEAPWLHFIVFAWVLLWRSATEAICPPGFRPPDCLHQCPRGRYGLGCASMCPVTCSTPTCRPDTGYCYRCRLGFQGRKCNKKCQEGWFGQDCLHMCGDTCLNGKCDAFTGACPGCEPGFYGTMCDQVGPVNQIRVAGDSYSKMMSKARNDSDFNQADLRARAERERMRTEFTEQERQAFFTMFLLLCSTLPICLLGACIYFLKERIKGAYSDVLKRKRWARFKDGFFTRTVIPTSKSRLLQKQTSDTQAPFERFVQVDNIGNNYKPSTEDLGAGDVRLDSKAQSKSKISHEVQCPSVLEVHQSTITSQDKAAQSEPSLWTADMDTTVPVGHRDSQQEGYTVRRPALWRRLIGKMTRRGSTKQENNRLESIENSRMGFGAESAGELFVHQLRKSPQAEPAESDSSSTSQEETSESDSGTSTSTSQDEGGAVRQDADCRKEQGLAVCTSPTRNNSRSPVGNRFWGVLKTVKDSLSTRSKKDHFVSDGNDPCFANLKAPVAILQTEASNHCGQCFVTIQSQDAEVQTAKAGPEKQLAGPNNNAEVSERGHKMFELLSRNVIQELRYLQALSDSNAFIERTVSDHVLAKSTQTSMVETSAAPTGDAQISGPEERASSYCKDRPKDMSPQLLREVGRGSPESFTRDALHGRQRDYEETKSVASMGKMMTLKLRLAKIFGRFSGRKSGLETLSRLDVDAIDPVVLQKLLQMRKQRPGKRSAPSSENRPNVGSLRDIYLDAMERKGAKTLEQCRDLDNLKQYMEAFPINGDHTNESGSLAEPCKPPRFETETRQTLLWRNFPHDNETLDPQSLNIPMGYREVLNSSRFPPTDPKLLAGEAEGFAESLYKLGTLERTVPMSRDSDAIVHNPAQEKTCLTRNFRPPISVPTSPRRLDIAEQRARPTGDRRFDRSQTSSFVPLRSAQNNYLIVASSDKDIECSHDSHLCLPKKNNNNFKHQPTSPKRSSEAGHTFDKSSFVETTKFVVTIPSPDCRLKHTGDIGLSVDGTTTTNDERARHTLNEDQVREASRESTQREEDIQDLKIPKKVSWKHVNIEGDCEKFLSCGDDSFKESVCEVRSNPEPPPNVEENHTASTHAFDLASVALGGIALPELQVPTNIVNTNCVPPMVLSHQQGQQNARGVSFLLVSPSAGAQKIQTQDWITSDERIDQKASTGKNIPASISRHCLSIQRPEGIRKISVPIKTDSAREEPVCAPESRRPHSPMKLNRGTCLKSLSETPKRCRGNHEDTDLACRDYLPDLPTSQLDDTRGRNAFFSPVLRQISQAAENSDTSQETSSTLCSLINAPPESSDTCIVVHDFEKSESKILETSEGANSRDHRNKRRRIPNAPSQIEETYRIDVSKICPVNTEDCSFQTPSADSSKSGKPVSAALSRDTKSEYSSSHHLERPTVNNERVENSSTQRSVSTPEVTFSTLEETSGSSSTLCVQRDSVNFAGKEPTLSMITDKREKPLPKKHPLRREKNHSPKLNADVSPTNKKEKSEERFIAPTEENSLPVPTLLEHSLQPGGEPTSLKFTGQAWRPIVCNTGSVPATTNIETAIPICQTLRDSEEFRSIHESSSERYYDALEPGPVFWAALQQDGNPRPGQKRRRGTSNTCKPHVSSSSSRRARAKSKPSEHSRTLPQAVLRFATQDNQAAAPTGEEKVHNQRKQAGPGSDIVLRFARPSTDSSTNPIPTKHRRSNNSKNTGAEQDHHGQGHDGMGRSSAGPASIRRDKKARESKVDSKEKPKHNGQSVKTDLLTKKSCKDRDRGSSSHRLETKEVCGVEESKRPPPQPALDSVRDTGYKIRVKPTEDVMRHSKNQQPEAHQFSDYNQHHTSDSSALASTHSSFQIQDWHNVLIGQHGKQVIAHREQPALPGFYIHGFPPPSLARMRSSIETNYYTHQPLQYGEDFGCIYNGQTRAATYGVNPSQQKPTQGSVRLDTFTGQSTSQFITCDPEQGSSYTQSLNNSGLQTQAHPGLKSYHPVPPAAVQNSDSQGAHQRNALHIQKQHGDQTATYLRQGIHSSHEMKFPQNQRGGFAPVPWRAGVPPPARYHTYQTSLHAPTFRTSQLHRPP